MARYEVRGVELGVDLLVDGVDHDLTEHGAGSSLLSYRGSGPDATSAETGRPDRQSTSQGPLPPVLLHYRHIPRQVGDLVATLCRRVGEATGARELMTARQVRRSAAATLLAVSAADPPPLGAQPVPASRVATVVLTPLVLDESMARPTLDGVIDDEAWTAATPYTDFVQQEPNDGQPATERTEVRVLVDKTAIYIGVISFDSEPTRSSSPRASATPASSRPTPSRLCSTRSTTARTGSCLAPTPWASSTTARWPGRARPAGVARGPAAGFAARPDQRLQPQLGRQLAGEIRDHGPGVGNGTVIPLKTLRYSPGEGPHLGLQRDEEHPPQERAGVSRAGRARLHAQHRLAGRQAHRS